MTGAIVRTVLFALLFMGTVLVYVPVILASGPGTEHWTLGPWHHVGLLPLTAGITGLAWCLRDFALVGRGTPAPFDPPLQLVATGNVIRSEGSTVALEFGQYEFRTMKTKPLQRPEAFHQYA